MSSIWNSSIEGDNSSSTIVITWCWSNIVRIRISIISKNSSYSSFFVSSLILEVHKSDIECISMTMVADTFFNINLFISVLIRFLGISNVVNITVSTIINLCNTDYFCSKIIIEIHETNLELVSGTNSFDSFAKFNFFIYTIRSCSCSNIDMIVLSERFDFFSKINTVSRSGK